ncbi:MAG: hypothetical protein HUJ98_09045, partial [Bacteroidaceae bacterium]|nr:hypothetical protein [Bacteroidaceae bacterium]
MKSLGIYLGIINVSIIFITTLFCIRYLNRVKADTESTNMNAFSAAAFTTEQAGFDYMKLQQDAVEGAANYINSRDMSLSEATAFLALNNVNEHISVHLIDGSTLSGISTHTDENGSNKVSYESLASVLPAPDCIPEALDRHICITHLYTNPVDGRESIGFLCSTVVDGKNYYLIRVVPGELLHTATEFKEEFSNAELALIDKEGHYIIPSASLTSDNFWDFLRVSNNLSYAQSEELKETMLSNQEVFSLKNSSGEDSLFICEPFEGDEDYCFVGYLPSNSLDSPALNLMLLFIVIFGFATLIVCDVSLLVYLNGEILKGMDAAKAANVAKTRFLSSMSHDIRTPMNAIVGMTT